MNGTASPSLSEQAAECRQLAKVAIDLPETGRLPRIAEEFDEKRSGLNGSAKCDDNVRGRVARTLFSGPAERI